MPFLASIEFCSCYSGECRVSSVLSRHVEAHATHLVTQDTLNTLDTSRLVLVENLLDGSGDLPVLGSGLDGADGGLSSLVSGGDEGSLDVGDGGGSDDDARW